MPRENRATDESAEPRERESKFDVTDVIGSIDATPEEIARPLFQSGPMTNKKVEARVRAEQS